jgi:iron complex outermembrane receptor protein
MRTLSCTQPIFPLTVLALACTSAWAQTAKAPTPAGEVETITVTAERRIENAKDVPVSATVLKTEQLETIGTAGQDVRVLAAKVPSLYIESSNGRTFPRFYLRGYGNTDFTAFASQPVSLIYDDVVLENPVLKGFPIFDLENVEVLRGPQGTLFGRNTPAGVVKFSSVKPEIGRSDGYASFSAGSRTTFNGEAALAIPLGTEWAMRVSLLDQHRADWVTNRSTDPKNSTAGQKTEGYDDRAGRIQLLYKPDARFSALFNLHARDLDGSARVFRANIIKQGTNDLVAGFDPATITTNGLNQQEYRSTGASANLSWDLGGLNLYSITGYESVGKYLTRGDIDGGDATNTPFSVETSGDLQKLRQFTQEFRVASKTSGPLNYQAGVYYFNDLVQPKNFGWNSVTGAQTSAQEVRQKNNAWAVFGSINYDLSSALKLRAGLRYTRDEKTFDTLLGFTNTLHKTITASKTTGDVSGTYKLSPDTSVYARLATGFRGASFASPAAGSQLLTDAAPETTTSYEAGVKSDLFERRARMSLSVFRYDVKGQQLTAVGGTSNQVALLNAKKTRGQGFELEGEAFVTTALRLSLGISLNDTEIRDPSLRVPICGSGKCTPLDPITLVGTSRQASIDGNPLPQAPKWVMTATARYGIPVGDGELYFYTDWSYRSKVNLFLYDSIEFTGKSLLEGGLKLGYNWGGGKYEASAFCRNCTNKIVVNGAIDFNNLEGFINDPRTYGLQFRMNF